MKWTKSKPKKAGYYWVRGLYREYPDEPWEHTDGSPDLLYIDPKEDEDKLTGMFWGWHWELDIDPKERAKGRLEFAGPIKQPDKSPTTRIRYET